MNATLLSRFDPLDRILFADDFDTGLNGWTLVMGNYEDSLDSMLEPYKGWRPPMLSNLTVWDTGTTGSFNGNYAMKLATTAKPEGMSYAIKRLTRRATGRLRAEYYFSFKPEPAELKLADTDVRCVAFGFDLQDGDRTSGARRVQPIVRYLNSHEGNRQQKWQFKRFLDEFYPIGGSGETVSFFPYGQTGWEDIPGGDQRLCYNEIATKINWHYLALDVDLGTMSMQQLRCNDRTFDLSALKAIEVKAMPNLWCMLQPFVYTQADTNRRAFFYIDSAVLSMEAL